MREQRLAAEISAAKRERDFYLSRVDKAKGVAAQQERKRKVPDQALVKHSLLLTEVDIAW